MGSWGLGCEVVHLRLCLRVVDWIGFGLFFFCELLRCVKKRDEIWVLGAPSFFEVLLLVLLDYPLGFSRFSSWTPRWGKC